MTFSVIDLDLSRYDEIATRFGIEKRESLSWLKSGIETRSDTFNKLIERIEQVSLATRAPILIEGPTGAGKSKLARRIYELKRQRKLIEGELIEINCATLRGDQAMSALFGHVKGAYTGATSNRDGYLKSADGGVLFLDEIGELGLDEQAMLLRAIEERRFQPVGSDRESNSDFQLLAGTNCNLRDAVRSGRFREDLLARINLWSFQLPGLANRREDIEPNLDYELEQYTAKSGRRVTINREAREKFLAFALSSRATWKANFRDLNAAVVRMATLAPGGRISATDVRAEVERLTQAWQSSEPADDDHGASVNDLKIDWNEMDRFDRTQLVDVIRVCRESKSLSEAGRKLFAVSRESKKKPNDADRLRKYLAKFGLDWKQI